MNAAYDYIRDGAEIYKNSFAIIRREADLGRFSREEERVAVRVIHASGMVEITPDLFFSPGAAQARNRGSGGWRADPVRRQHGGPWRYARKVARQ